MMKTREHTMEYFEKKYQEIRQYAIDKGLEQPYHDINSFISDYEYMRLHGVKNITKEMKYYAQYEVSYDTARAMLSKAKEFGGTEKLKELKSMTTREFAGKYLNELKAAQEQAQEMFGDKINPKTGKFERIEYIGVMWFGSD